MTCHKGDLNHPSYQAMYWFRVAAARCFLRFTCRFTGGSTQRPAFENLAVLGWLVKAHLPFGLVTTLIVGGVGAIGYPF